MEPLPLRPNPCNNAAQRAAAFRAIDIADKVFTVHCQLAPFTGEYNADTLGQIVYILSRGEALLKGVPPADIKSASMVISVANMILPYREAMTQADARSRMMLEIWKFMQVSITGSDVVDFDGVVYAELVQPPAEGRGPGPWFGHHLPPTVDAFQALLAPPEDFNDRDFLTVLDTLVARIKPDYQHINTAIFVHAQIAFPKRGSLTETKAEKISDELRQTLGYPVRIMDKAIRDIYERLSPKILDNEWENLLTGWAREMETVNLRMRVTLMQAAGGGLTVFETIKSALHQFPDFPWGLAFEALGQDVANYERAKNLIGNDRFYGFRKDLKEAASTYYRSFGYLAKQLLLRHGGPDYAGLAQYQGWTRNPRNKARLDELVTNFNPDNPVEMTPAEREAQRLQGRQRRDQLIAIPAPVPPVVVGQIPPPPPAQ